MRIRNNQPLIIMAKWGECDEEVAFVTEVQYQKMDSLLIRWLCCLIKMANYMHKEVRMM